MTRRVFIWIEIGVLVLFFLVIGAVKSVGSEEGAGSPVKVVSSCGVDLNRDGVSDIALLIERVKGRELIVLMTNKRGYNAFVLSREMPNNMELYCRLGKYIKETEAGPGQRTPKYHKTLGTYLELVQPESSSVAYYLTGKGFKEVSTSD